MFRVVVILPGGERGTNALTFETREEADQYGFDLLCRWFVPESYEVEEVPLTPQQEHLAIQHENGGHEYGCPEGCPEIEEIQCTSDDPTNHQGNTCPVHESS